MQSHQKPQLLPKAKSLLGRQNIQDVQTTAQLEVEQPDAHILSNFNAIFFRHHILRLLQLLKYTADDIKPPVRL